MLLSEAKEILKKNGYRLVEDTGMSPDEEKFWFQSGPSTEVKKELQNWMQNFGNGTYYARDGFKEMESLLWDIMDGVFARNGKTDDLKTKFSERMSKIRQGVELQNQWLDKLESIMNNA